MGIAGFFESLGGKPVLEKVHKIFYDKIYAHPWIGQYFTHIDQKHIENQQTDFMMDAFGGPKQYSGALPIPAHKHMNTSMELFELRSMLLKQSLHEAGVSAEHQEIWLKVDSAFKNGIIKKSIEDCEKRYFTDTILSFPNPDSVKKAA